VLKGRVDGISTPAHLPLACSSGQLIATADTPALASDITLLPDITVVVLEAVAEVA
jgi:hypothetical protein